jgi:hypothetical protein
MMLIYPDLDAADRSRALMRQFGVTIGPH